MLRLEEETERDRKGKNAIHKERPKNAPKNGESERQKDEKLQLYMGCSSKEVWKSNFRQYGQMKSRAGQRQREEED